MNEIIGKPGEGGLSKEIFNRKLPYHGIINGISGNPLSIDLSHGQISISDLKPGSPCHFIATCDVEGMVKFDIVTRGFNGNSWIKHPDLYAGELIRESFKYFLKNGLNPQQVIAEWSYDPDDPLHSSDYYDQFFASLPDNITDYPSDLLIQAASNTKAGKLLSNLGVNNLKFLPKHVEIRKIGRKSQIIVKFERVID